MISQKISQAALLLIATFAHAHGENKPGPHGGEIRMPGAFHVEVKLSGRELQVFLLDIEFKSPVIENSSVEIFATRGQESPVALPCRPSKVATSPHFVCLNPRFQLKDGDLLKVRTKRGEMKGQDVEVRLPLIRAHAAAFKGT